MLTLFSFMYTFILDKMCVKPNGRWTSWTHCNVMHTRVQSRMQQLDAHPSPGRCTDYNINDLAEVKMCTAKQGTHE